MKILHPRVCFGSRRWQGEEGRLFNMDVRPRCAARTSPSVWWQRVGRTLLDLAGIQTSARERGFCQEKWERERERGERERRGESLAAFYICPDNTSSLKFPY